MANTIITEALLQKEVIRLKDKKTIIKQIANTKFEGQLKQQGDTVSVQTFPDTFGVVGGTAGDAIVIRDWAITKEQLTVNEVFQNGAKVKDIEEIQSNLAIRSKLAARFAYASANNEDQFVASLVTQAYADNKLQDRNPLTLTSSTTYSAVTALKRVLSQQNAFESGMLFLSPAILEKIKLEDILDSSDKGLEIRLNGRVGKIDGFEIMETNNLPHVVTLTVDTIPVAANTMSISGLEPDTASRNGFKERAVVFTFVAAASAAVAGDIAIGANVAAAQVNLVNAINGTGTAGATTYIEIAEADRAALKNAFIKAGTTWSASDIINIQSSRTLTVAETFGPATNIFGSDATLMFAADREAINFVSQMDKFKVKDLTDSFAANILQEKVYDGIVFAENSKGLATIEIAV